MTSLIQYWQKNKWTVLVGAVVALFLASSAPWWWPWKSQEKSPEIPAQIQVKDSIIAIGNSGPVNQTINKLDLPEPKFKWKTVSENNPVDGLYESEFILEIVSSTAINNLYVEVRAPSITDMDYVTQRRGIDIGGTMATREGYAFANIQSAWGSYKFVITTSEKEEIKASNISIEYQ